MNFYDLGGDLDNHLRANAAMRTSSEGMYAAVRAAHSSGSSDSKAAEAPAGNPADAGANPAPTTPKRRRNRKR